MVRSMLAWSRLRVEPETASSARPSVAGRPKMAAALRASLLGGWVAGTLDIGAACLINWRSPYFICQAIAAGVFGTASFDMSTSSAVAGLLLQWFMSVLIAGIYAGASDWLPVLRRRWIFCGCAYGIPVFAVMSYVVMPLSAVGHVAHLTLAKGVENFLAMIWFGFVVGYFARESVW